MKTKLPHTIDSGHGEVIVFKEIIHEPDGDKIIIEGQVQPNCGPPMHVHYKQDEHFHVLQGTMAYQIPDQKVGYLKVGQSVTFLKNTPHKFWNSGADELILNTWVKPANNIVLYLSTLYAATNTQKTAKLNAFDGAYLTTMYKNEYDLLEIPSLMKKIIIPITFFIGKLVGKYKKFDKKPIPIK